MPTLMFVAPIRAGQEEAYRRFAQELLGSRRLAHAASRRGLGLGRETLWLAHMPLGELAVVRLEAAEPGGVLAGLAASGLTFDGWLREQWLALMGCELARAARLGRLERLFEWKAAERLAALQNPQSSAGVEQKETIK